MNSKDYTYLPPPEARRSEPVEDIFSEHELAGFLDRLLADEKLLDKAVGVIRSAGVAERLERLRVRVQAAPPDELPSVEETRVAVLGLLRALVEGRLDRTELAGLEPLVHEIAALEQAFQVLLLEGEVGRQRMVDELYGEHPELLCPHFLNPDTQLVGTVRERLRRKSEEHRASLPQLPAPRGRRRR